MRARYLVLTAALACLIALSAAQSSHAATLGELTQKPGTLGCISVDGSGGECGTSPSLAGSGFSSVAVSPDGRSLYAADRGSYAIAIFDRDPQNGALTQKPGTAGCISQDGSGGACGDGRALRGAAPYR